MASSGAAQTAIQKYSRYYGVPVWISDSIAQTESGMNPSAAGDYSPTTKRYTSFGLFQLHQNGGQGTGYTAQQLENPNTNAQIGIHALAPAYQAGLKKGLIGYPLLQYIAGHSGHPDYTGTLPAAYNTRLHQAYNTAMAQQPGTTSGSNQASGSSTGNTIVGGLKQIGFALLGGGVAIAGIWVLFKQG